MNKRVLLLLLAVTLSVISSAQFVSVKNGDWRDPLTWSTDLQATALPDSTTDVIILHLVTVSSLSKDCRCKSMFILEGATLANYSSASVGSNIIVEKDFINRGTLNATNHYFDITVRGDFINYGVVTKAASSAYFELHLRGNLQNKGSYRGFSSTDFIGGNGEHTHQIKSLNDSTIYLGEASLSDNLGTIMIDSMAIINSSAFNLKQGKLIIPPSIPYENKLIFDGGSILDGTIIAYRNKIYTKPGTWLGLGKNYAPDKNTYIQDAILDGNFLIGGDGDASSVVLQGENRLTGNITDWFSSGAYSAGDRGLKLEGMFTNEGRIFNASTGGTNYGLWIIQMPASLFFNKHDSLNIKAHKFYGSCTFSNDKDTIITPLWEGKDSTTFVNLLSDIHFRKTVTIDMKGGILVLPPQGKFKTLFGSQNILRNTKIEANGSEIYLPCSYENNVFNNPDFRLTYFRNETTLTGQVTVSGAIAPYYDYAPTVKIHGSIYNKGSVVNHPTRGTLNLEVTGNITHDGIAWKNAYTRLNGLLHQFVLMPNDSIIKGIVVFESVLKGTNYQWKKDNINLTGETASQLTFNNGINKSHYGVYQCFINETTPSRTITIGKETPPAFRIFDVQIKNIGLRSTMIQWKTSAPAKGFVFYAENDKSNGYPLEAMENGTLVTEHQMILDSLTQGSTYYFILDQNDSEWNNIRSQEFSFVAGDLTSGVIEIHKMWEVPQDIHLYNFPNPFTQSTRICFELPETSRVEISILDLSGKVIESLMDETRFMGKQSLVFHARSLAHGIYFYRVKTSKNTITKKMVIQ